MSCDQITLKIKSTHLLLALLFLAACTPNKPIEDSANAASDAPITQVLGALCDKQVVLLGEGPYHGDGMTEAFKAELVQTLIETCGFELILFEGSFYEYSKLDAQIAQNYGGNSEDIKTALGGLWKNDAEMQPLIMFLTEAQNTRRIRLGGIDDQLGRRGQDYANYEMPDEISEGLNPKIRDSCQAALETRILYNFSKDDPYSHAKKQHLLNCFDGGTVSGGGSRTSPLIAAMRENVYRTIDRDFSNETEKLAGRASSMYWNFEYWYNQYPNPPKTVIWTATVHAAKSGKVLKSLSDSPNLGQHIRNRFGDNAYALGFSALGGSIRKFRAIEPLPKAPENSLEAITLGSNDLDMVFIGTEALKEFGSVPARAINNHYQSAYWPDLLDGIVVFREQKPTQILEGLE